MVRDLRREKVVDGVESYCLSDAKLLGALYRPNGVDPNILKSIDCTFRERLYRFIGGSKDDSRLLPLKDIRTELFALYPAIGGWLEEHLAKIQTSWMSYDEYLEKSAKSEIFIDLVRVSQEEGFSFRIPEALFLNRKIITNRLIARDEPFYSPERVFLIGVDPVSRLKEFLEADLEPLPESILRFYNSRLWWTDQDPVKEFQEIMK